MILWGFAAFALLPACSSNDNPRLEDIAKQYGASYCVKLEECVGPDEFIASYPGGQEECATKAFRIHGTDERSLCSQEEWDDCFDKLEDSTCVTDDAGTSRPKIPDTCQGC